MIKVITYGTYGMLHYGHIRLLQRARLLGACLIAGVPSGDYDKTRGKISSRQSLMERVNAVRRTGFADEIAAEEYEGQKIDDIKRLGVDIFTVGSDWEGHFDYLNEYCKVIYLPRTEGISSSSIRTEKRRLSIGIIGAASFVAKFIDEAKFVNGVHVTGIYAPGREEIPGMFRAESRTELLERSEAVYVVSRPENHYDDVKAALNAGKHVLCESPVAMSEPECRELFALARKNCLILMDSVCTSLNEGLPESDDEPGRKWNTMCGWGPIALLPVLQILGTDYTGKTYFTKFFDREANLDEFTKIDFTYPSAVASIKIAKGAKSEGTLIITGTSGYIYVPATWWKTDYFEVRYEDQNRTNRFFYQLDGEGIRYEIVVFAKSVELARSTSSISEDVSETVCRIIGDFNARKDMVEFR